MTINGYPHIVYDELASFFFFFFFAKFHTNFFTVFLKTHCTAWNIFGIETVVVGLIYILEEQNLIHLPHSSADSAMQTLNSQDGQIKGSDFILFGSPPH